MLRQQPDHRMDQEIGGDAELEAAIKQARQEGLEKDRQARVTQAKETLSKMDPNQLMDVELTDEMREMTKTPQQPKPGLLNKLKSWFSK